MELHEVVRTVSIDGLERVDIARSYENDTGHSS